MSSQNLYVCGESPSDRIHKHTSHLGATLTGTGDTAAGKDMALLLVALHGVTQKVFLRREKEVLRRSV